MFLCNHCPFVVHLHPHLPEFVKQYQKKGIDFVAISSNDVVNYPQDHPDLMKVLAQKFDYSFPYLYDESQDVAKAFSAACTPDFFVYNPSKELIIVASMMTAGLKMANPLPEKI